MTRTMNLGPGARVLLDGSGPSGLVLKRRAPEGYLWVKWPWMMRPTCHPVGHLTWVPIVSDEVCKTASRLLRIAKAFLDTPRQEIAAEGLKVYETLAATGLDENTLSGLLESLDPETCGRFCRSHSRWSCEPEGTQ